MGLPFYQGRGALAEEHPAHEVRREVHHAPPVTADQQPGIEPWFGVWGLRFGVKCWGLGIWGLGLRAQGLGFKVKGLGLGV